MYSWGSSVHSPRGKTRRRSKRSLWRKITSRVSNRTISGCMINPKLSTTCLTMSKCRWRWITRPTFVLVWIRSEKAVNQWSILRAASWRIWKPKTINLNAGARYRGCREMALLRSRTTLIGKKPSERNWKIRRKLLMKIRKDSAHSSIRMSWSKFRRRMRPPEKK